MATWIKAELQFDEDIPLEEAVQTLGEAVLDGTASLEHDDEEGDEV